MATQSATQDNDDLEALFDSILEANNAENNTNVTPLSASLGEAVTAESGEKVINQIGHMARTLHDTLRELGLNKEVEKAASSIPDARAEAAGAAVLAVPALFTTPPPCSPAARPLKPYLI